MRKPTLSLLVALTLVIGCMPAFPAYGLQAADSSFLESIDESSQEEFTAESIDDPSQEEFTTAASSEKETNNSRATADTISANSEMTGKISATDDVDWYKFTMPARGHIAFGLVPAAGIIDSKEYWEVGLYDSTGKYIFSRHFKGNATNLANVYSAKTGLAAGTVVYIRVARGDNYYTTNSYKLRINYAATDNWEIESNGTKETATTISPNVEYFGSITVTWNSVYGDYDWYRIVTPSAGYVSFSFRHPATGSSHAVWEAKLYRTDLWMSTGVVSYPYKGDAAKIETSDTFELPAGTYYIRVCSSYSFSDADYGLKFNFTPYASTSKMVRLYNKWTGEHLFTSDSNEVSKLKKLGWKNEGVAWNAPASGTKVYRLYNKYSGDHHYTSSESEYNKCKKAGWKGEGVAFYSGGTKPVYRLYNKYVKSFYHHYTMDKTEFSKCKKAGWKDEGIGWYGM